MVLVFKILLPIWEEELFKSSKVENVTSWSKTTDYNPQSYAFFCCDFTLMEGGNKQGDKLSGKESS